MGVEISSTAFGWKPTSLAVTAPANSSSQAQRHPSTAQGSLNFIQAPIICFQDRLLTESALWMLSSLGCVAGMTAAHLMVGLNWKRAIEMIRGMKNRNKMCKHFSVWSRDEWEGF